MAKGASAEKAVRVGPSIPGAWQGIAVQLADLTENDRAPAESCTTEAAPVAPVHVVEET